MEKIVNKIESEQYKILQVGIKVNNMIDTEGWKEIVEPAIENAITNIVGGKINGKWVKGKLNGNCRKDETIAYYIGYKDALINFYNEILGAIEDAKVAKDRLTNDKKVVKKSFNSFEKE